MEYGGLSQNSQRPSNSFYPNVDENRPCPYPSTLSYMLMPFLYLGLGFPHGICLSDFPIKMVLIANLFLNIR
jgi:hypothetical protein